MEKKGIDELVLKIWEKSIDVQIHFNDLIMRNRTIVVSFITAVFGAAAYSLKESALIIKIYKMSIPISCIIILFGICFLLAYAYLDYYYYLRLLIGAVKFTEEMDLQYKEIGLTTKISKEIKHKRVIKVLKRHYIILIGSAIILFFLILFSK